MRHFTTEQLRTARKTNLYDFLLLHHPHDFKKSSNSLRYKNNSSISIKSGYCGYCDFSTSEKGNSIDFLTKYMGYPLDDAVFALCGESTPSYMLPPSDFVPQIKVPPQFPLPTPGPFKQLFAYLQARGISAKTLQKLIDRELLYQDNRNNIVFVNKDRDWGERRGTNTFADVRCKLRNECSDFKSQEQGWCQRMHNCPNYKKDTFRGMIAGSRQDGYWCFKGGLGEPTKAYICEASIDAISLYELHIKQGRKEHALYVSIGGIAKQPAIDRLKALMPVILAVDNDAAGEECRKRNSDLEFIIPQHKDWNDDLLALSNSSFSSP